MKFKEIKYIKVNNCFYLIYYFVIRRKKFKYMYIFKWNENCLLIGEFEIW